MRERPILFSAPMVRGILDGRKTQTRRVVKPQPYIDERGNVCVPDPKKPGSHTMYGQTPAGEPQWESFKRWRCPYGVPGDRLWVRETLRYDWVTECWRFDATSDRLGVLFGRELERPRPDRWPTGVCPSIHMPRWASRISLRITDVRVERLNDCSEDDAIAEGLRWRPALEAWSAMPEDSWPTYRDPRRSYAGLWDHINGHGSWAANPFVWAVTFERVTP